MADSEIKSQAEKKEKKPILTREYQIWLLIGTFYILLISVTRIDLVGTALIIFAYLLGKAIQEHGLKFIEININKGKE